MEIIINIPPCPKPRMTRRDKWSNTRTKQASKYFKWKDLFVLLCKQNDFAPTNTLPNIRFEFEPAKSASKARRAYLIGKPHEFKPDIDNCLKSILDSIFNNDQKVHQIGTMNKVWAEKSRIVFYTT